MTALYQSQQVVIYTEGPFSAEVTIDALDWLPFGPYNQDAGFQGNLVVYARTLSG